MPKCIPFLAKLKGEGRSCWNGKAKTYPLNYLLHMGIMLTIILFLLAGIGNILAISKLSQYVLLQLRVKVYSLLGQTEGERKTFFKGCKKGGTFWDYSQEHLVVIRDEKVSPFVKFETILPFLYFLLDPLTNKHCRTWSSMINFWINSRTSQK